MAVCDITKRAGVSRATFYKLFENKVQCLVAAQQRAIEGLEATVRDACGSERDWPSGVAAAVGAMVEFAAEFPGDARLVLASSQAAAEPELARQGVAVHKQFGDLLRKSAAACPSARVPDGLTERAAIGAATSLLAGYLIGEEVEAIPKLKTDLVQIILAPYLGDHEAKRIGLAAV
jgi:AcrR family transcriptional regulator